MYKCGSISVVSAVSTRSPQLSQSYRRWWWWRCAKAFNIKQWYISRVFQRTVQVSLPCRDMCATMSKTEGTWTEIPRSDQSKRFKKYIYINHKILGGKKKWTEKWWGITSRCLEPICHLVEKKGSNTRHKLRCDCSLILQCFRWGTERSDYKTERGEEISVTDETSCGSTGFRVES